MASEQETQNTTETNNESTLTLLAMIGGLGVVTMVVAAGVGVVLENVDTAIVGLFVMAGFGLLVAGIAGWFIVVRPLENIDDITVPKYHGHHHEDHDGHGDDSHSDH